MSTTLFRAACAMALLAPMALASAPAVAYPDQPVTLVVPWPPGGGSDILMRMLADEASGRLGQPVVVVNKPGAGGSIGLREVADSPPDGYTISMIATGFISQQYGNPNAPELGDYDIIAYVGTDPAALSANIDTGWQSLEDFIAAAKAAPGSIRNGNDQPGGSSYLAIALMENALGVQVTRVPYAGYAPTLQALLSGEVQTATVSVPDMADPHKEGRLRILAVAGDDRHRMAPDVPTFNELGFPLVTGTMRAIVAPKGLDPAVLAALEEAIVGALDDPAFRQKTDAAGFSIAPVGSAAASELVYQMDADIYPVLLEGDMVQVRRKEG
jgi:tripartite-type tricarboxylate transporter receptor subunit TctC